MWLSAVIERKYCGQKQKIRLGDEILPYTVLAHSIANFGSYGNTLAVGVQVTQTAVLCSCICICDNV